MFLVPGLLKLKVTLEKLNFRKGNYSACHFGCISCMNYRERCHLCWYEPAIKMVQSPVRLHQLETPSTDYIPQAVLNSHRQNEVHHYLFVGVIHFVYPRFILISFGKTIIC